MTHNLTKHDRQTIRLQGYDYSQAGFYFVTICTHDQRMLFGEIDSGIMILNEYGKIVYNEWVKSEKIRNNIKMNTFVVMPNHFHGIIEIIPRRGVLNTPIVNTPAPNLPISNMSVLRKNNETRKRAYYNTPLRSPSQTVGAIIRGF